MPDPSHAAPPARPKPTVPLRVPRPAVPRWACVDRSPPRPVHGRWSRLGPRPTVPRSPAPCSSGAARARPTVPVGPAAGGAPRSMRPGAGHAESDGADGVVNQDGPSGTAHGSSEVVKAHTPRRGRHSCRNSQDSRWAREPEAHRDWQAAGDSDDSLAGAGPGHRRGRRDGGTPALTLARRAGTWLRPAPGPLRPGRSDCQPPSQAGWQAPPDAAWAADRPRPRRRSGRGCGPLQAARGQSAVPG
jgi:hypothetical protein